MSAQQKQEGRVMLPAATVRQAIVRKLIKRLGVQECSNYTDWIFMKTLHTATKRRSLTWTKGHY